MGSISIATAADLANKNQNFSIVTHDGVFHADEVMAIAIIAFVLRNNDLLIARSRDPEVIARATLNVVDVGATYDVNKWPLRLDHHQWQPRKGEGLRENGVALASAGLAWKHYGKLTIAGSFPNASTFQTNKVWEAIDRKVMQGIDASDTGTMPRSEGPSVCSISSIISSFNPADGVEPEIEFLEAIQFAKETLIRFIAMEIRAVLAYEPIYCQALACEEPVLVLESGGNWQEAVIDSNAGKEKGIDFVVYQDPRGQWMCQCVPPSLGSFDKRRPLPESWAALRDKAFQAVTGVQDAIFCHSGRFICGAESKEGALRLAAYALMS